MPKGNKNWQFIIYAESIQPNAFMLLSALGYRGYISPLHDSDLWTEDDEKNNSGHVAGTKKKAHYHVIVCLNSCYQNMNKVVNDIIIPISLPDKANKYAEPVLFMNESVRYLIHADQPDKFQYDMRDIITFGNVRPLTYYFNSKDDSDSYDFIEKLIHTEKITRLYALIYRLKNLEKYDELELVRKKHYYFLALIRENYIISDNI